MAGFIGSLLGLGGGIIIIPALSLFSGIPINQAIGASIVSVIATSSGAAIAYVRDKITNIRIGMFLETATTLGAITGVFIAGLISTKALYIIFALLMFYLAGVMFKKRNSESLKQGRQPSGQADRQEQSDLSFGRAEHPFVKRLKLNNEYYDMALGQVVAYQVTGVYPGYAVMYAAGVISGLLGIGSGVFKVLGMDVFMKLPMKVSTATSNFMIGVTAAASAGVYFLRGDINPLVAGPVALGVLLGAQAGTKVMARLNNKTLRFIFIPILIYIAMEMFWKGRSM